eukprot:TRINITY_DN8796_c0_g1_i1.p1 TRINITY_DN8796_c0_g1~~TRINITY_DN8796_c0_g1_i1.p1  ORF type:complete len:429 (-),score=122.62 TRINITY_DN8796_c0_g1_i1:119-1405(-)
MSYLLLSLFALLAGSAVALPYGKGSGVTELTSKTFAQEVFSTEHVWVVEFYAPWCGHCKSLEPEYTKAAANLKGIVKVGAVNCDEESNKQLCGQFGIQGFPTLKIFPSQLKKQGKGVVKDPIDYQGPRTGAAIAKAALEKLPSFITSVTSKTEEKFLSGEPELAKVLLFTNKATTSNLYKALSVDFHHRLSLGEVRHSDKALVAKYEVESFPTLLVITKDGDKLVFDEDLKHDTLTKFLSPHAKPLERAPEPEAESASEKKPKKEKVPPPPPEVVHDPQEEVTTPEQFDSICTNTAKSCLVAVLDTVNTDAESHQRYLQVLAAVHEKNQKFFNVLWINGVGQPDFLNALNMYSGFPAVTVLNHKKSSAVSYVGSFSTEAINDFCGGVMRGAKRAYPLKAFPTIVKAEPIAAAPVEEASENEPEAKDEL